MLPIRFTVTRRPMQTILEQIVEHKRGEIAQRMRDEPIELLKAKIATLDRPRNFFSAVTRKPQKKPINLIAEIKKASPSAGVIREDFDPIDLASQYAAAGADAISVLTDEKFFQGRLDYIKAVRDVVNLPVLRKDFLVDPYQVYESRAAGADAILLIAELLRTEELIDLQILATELNLTCLIEVHDMDDLMRVRDHVIGFPHRTYSLIGINNRDLNTFKTDIRTTLRLLELIEDKDVLVSESGIHTRADVDRLAKEGVRAVLIGESLMRSSDIRGKIGELFG
jgi:indole-3-glycerol phosphate synthase